MHKVILSLCILFLALSASAQTVPPPPALSASYIVVMAPNGQGIMAPGFISLGPGLTVKLVDGKAVLDVVAPTTPPPAATPSKRKYDVVLTRSAEGAYPLPTGATNMVVHVNGIRYREAGNWVIEGVNLKPIASNWPPDADVTIDYDEQTL